jgi:hypothetical protein
VTDNGETANYTCDVGYSIDGAMSRTCAKDGTRWSGSDPVCSKYCRLMFVVSFGGEDAEGRTHKNTHSAYISHIDISHILNRNEYLSYSNFIDRSFIIFFFIYLFFIQIILFVYLRPMSDIGVTNRRFRNYDF